MKAHQRITCVFWNHVIVEAYVWSFPFDKGKLELFLRYYMQYACNYNCITLHVENCTHVKHSFISPLSISPPSPLILPTLLIPISFVMHHINFSFLASYPFLFAILPHFANFTSSPLFPFIFPSAFHFLSSPMCSSNYFPFRLSVSHMQVHLNPFFFSFSLFAFLFYFLILFLLPSLIFSTLYRICNLETPVADVMGEFYFSRKIPPPPPNIPIL